MTCRVRQPEVELSLNQHSLISGGPALLQHFRIDLDHSNAFRSLEADGLTRCGNPTPEQYAGLERASHPPPC